MRTLLLFSFLFFMGCSSHYAPLKTVEKVDIQKYAGTWYEIARYEHSFEKGCSDVNATYTLEAEGKIKVVNRCMRSDGLSKAEGVAYATDTTNAKLKVSFFRPFYGNYWVLMLGENYEYALVGEESREYLWILSRTPTLSNELKEKILSKLPQFGYSAKKLIWTTHKGNE